MDKTPPTVTGRPADSEVKLCPRPVFYVRYSDELSGADASSLQVLLDNNDITANFHRFGAGAYYKPASDLSTGQHTWQVTVADQAGSVVTAAAMFTVDQNASSSYCEFPNVNITDGMAMPDVEAVWVQGQRNSDTEAVTFTVNFGDEQPFNARWDQFGFLVPLDFGTNIVILTGSGGAEAAYVVTRSDRYRAKLNAPGSGDFVMDGPAMGYFANGQPQTASGYASQTLDAGTPDEAVLLSVTVNGVPCSITGPDANGNMSFTGLSSCSVSTNFTSATVTVCYTNSVGTQCHSIPLGVWEGYFILRKRWELNYYSPMYGQEFTRNEENPDGSCGGDATLWKSYPWDHLERWIYRFDPPSAGQTDPNEQAEVYYLMANGNCVSGEPPDVSFPTYGPEEWPGVFLTNSVSQPNEGHFGFLSVPPRGMRFGNEGGWEYFIHDYNCNGIVDWEHLGFGWIDADLGENSMTFRAPVYYGTNTPVIFTFEGVGYRTDPGVPMDLTQVKFKDPNGTTYLDPVTTNENQVGYLITVTGGQDYTLTKDSFHWPLSAITNVFTEALGNECGTGFTRKAYALGNRLTFSGFHNAAFGVRLQSAEFGGSKYPLMRGGSGFASDGTSPAPVPELNQGQFASPLCYKVSSSPTITATFALDPPLAGSVPARIRIEGEQIGSGATLVYERNLLFTGSAATASFSVLNPAVHKLRSYVDNTKLKLRWKISFDAGATFHSFDITEQDLFVTLDAPSGAPATWWRVYNVTREAQGQTDVQGSACAIIHWVDSTMSGRYGNSYTPTTTPIWGRLDQGTDYDCLEVAQIAWKALQMLGVSNSGTDVAYPTGAIPLGNHSTTNQETKQSTHEPGRTLILRYGANNWLNSYEGYVWYYVGTEKVIHSIWPNKGSYRGSDAGLRLLHEMSIYQVWTYDDASNVRHIDTNEPAPVTLPTPSNTSQPFLCP